MTKREREHFTTTVYGTEAAARRERDARARRLPVVIAIMAGLAVLVAVPVALLCYIIASKLPQLGGY